MCDRQEGGDNDSKATEVSIRSKLELIIDYGLVRTYAVVIGSITMFPAKMTSTRTRANMMSDSEVLGVLGKRPLLNLSRRRARGNSDMTTSQTSENLRIMTECLFGFLRTHILEITSKLAPVLA